MAIIEMFEECYAVADFAALIWDLDLEPGPGPKLCYKIRTTLPTSVFAAEVESLPISLDSLSCNKDDPIYDEEEDLEDPNFSPSSEDFLQASEAWSDTSFQKSEVCSNN